MGPKRSNSPWVSGPEICRYLGINQDALRYRREHIWTEGTHWRRISPRRYAYHVERIEEFAYDELGMK